MKLPRFVGRYLCFIGAHELRTLYHHGDQLFCITAWARCERCGRLLVFNGVYWEPSSLSEDELKALAEQGVIRSMQ